MYDLTIDLAAMVHWRNEPAVNNKRLGIG